MADKKIKYRIVLIRLGERIPQYALDYSDESKCKASVEFLNSTLPDNLKEEEYYDYEKVITYSK